MIFFFFFSFTFFFFLYFFLFVICNFFIFFYFLFYLLLAPSVKPVHSWSMLDIKDNGLTGETATKEIYGNPSLYTHGDLQLVDGGVTFDGKSSHIVGDLAPDDCLINPEQCPSGFSIGTKLKFNMKSTGHVDPRFIFDTGATHANNYRGVSLFIKNGKLNGLVKGAERLWKVESIMHSMHSHK